MDVNGVEISDEQFSFVFSRSSGPGGQNVNKVNTRVTLLFDVANCDELDARQKEIVKRKLKTRVNSDGVLRVIAQAERTQAGNKRLAVERLQELLSEALKTRKVRKKSKPSKAAVQKRLDDKKSRSKIKQMRTRVVE